MTTGKLTVAILVAVFAARIVAAPGVAWSASDSYVVGRIVGTHQPVPIRFAGSDNLEERGIDEVEFRGFRLVRDNGKKFSIYPNRDGFFQQALPGGKYTLLRQRYDRPSYREEPVIKLFSFTVPTAALINLGTLDLVLEGKPSESLYSFPWGDRGIYTYRYRYERRAGEVAYTEPMEWFRNKEAKVFGELEKKARRVEAQPAGIWDSSEVVIEDREVPWQLLD